MADSRPYLAELFDLAFGVKSPVFLTSDLGLGDAVENLIRPGAKDVKYIGVQVKQEKKAKATSWMGTPIVYQFKLKGRTYKTYNGRGELVDHTLEDFIMPVATMIDFSRAKNIIETELQGGWDTVKEQYGFGSWKIRIRGICLNEPGRTSDEQKQTLLKWEKVCGSVGVSGSLFLEKEIFALAITSMSFQQLEKQPYVLPFEMECVSDTDPLLA